MKASAKPVVVMVCGDPGGAAALAPVMKRLFADGLTEVRPLAYSHAKTILRQRGIPYTCLDGWRGPIGARLRQLNASLVLTATSLNTVNAEKRFIASARRLGIPSVAVLDFWSNYRPRFSDGRGRLAYVPDVVAVMDHRAREQMLRQGFDANRLVVTGQPAFDLLDARRRGFSANLREAVRASLGASNGWLVAWVSQPLAAFYGTDMHNPLHPGYDEHQALGLLVKALERITADFGRPVTLAIRPHPRDALTSFEKIESTALTITVTTQLDPHELLLSADVVAGMSSALLVEACFLDCPTISLQPGLRIPDALPTNEWGLSKAAYRAEDVEPLVRRVLASSQTSSARRNSSYRAQHRGAARRVASLAYQVLASRGSCLTC